MQFSNIFSEERAVSPVIGVILMVAITVILAAVIGTFVLGLSDQVGDTNPRASFEFDKDVKTAKDSVGDTSEITVVTITHESGDSVDEPNVEVTVNGNPAYEATDLTTAADPVIANSWNDASEQVTAGDSYQIAFFGASGTTFTTGNTLDVAATGTDGYATTNADEIDSGDTIRVVYNSPDSDSSSTLVKHEVN